MTDFPYRLTLVTDRLLMRGRGLLELVESAVAGGVQLVQLREKQASTREFLELARALRGLLQPRKVPLVINDRVDIALAVEAAGVHLGQTDMPPAEARRLLGPRALIGLSVESLDDAFAAEGEEVDYLGLSPIFSTPTKSELNHSLGLEGIREIRSQSRHPLIAIGGIHVGNAAQVKAAGAHGIAVVSAICSAEDPCHSAAELSRLLVDERLISSGHTNSRIISHPC